MVLQRITSFLSYGFVHNLSGMPIIRKLARFINAHFSPKKDFLLKIENHRMYADTVDRIIALHFWKFLASGSSETKSMKKTIKKGMTVIDIGANIGYYTLMFADLAGEKGRVYAFEPDPSNYRLLVKNIEANGYKNVIAMQKAVSNKSGVIDFYHSEGHRGDHRSYDPGDGERKKIKVKSETIDRFTGKKIIPDIVKIDVQGAEFLVIQGMKNLIKRNKGLTILCEFCPRYMKKAGFSPGRFLDLLEQLGFELALINEKKGTIEQIEPSALMKICKGNKYANLFLKR